MFLKTKATGEVVNDGKQNSNLIRVEKLWTDPLNFLISGADMRDHDINIL